MFRRKVSEWEGQQQRSSETRTKENVIKAIVCALDQSRDHCRRGPCCKPEMGHRDAAFLPQYWATQVERSLMTSRGSPRIVRLQAIYPGSACPIRVWPGYEIAGCRPLPTATRTCTRSSTSTRAPSGPTGARDGSPGISQRQIYRGHGTDPSGCRDVTSRPRIIDDMVAAISIWMGSPG